MNILKLSLLLAICLGVSSCAHCKRGCSAPVTPSEIKLLRITAAVDGSGRIIFNGDSARYEHKFWTPLWNVTFDGQPWTELSTTPVGWATLSRELDLPAARIVNRTGRDVIALEPTAEGFDLYLNDTPNGADDYTVTIAIPKRH